VFEIAVDEHDKLVRAKISGVMTPAEARQFHDEIVAIALVARARFGSFRLIADTLDAPVQPAEVLSELPAPGAVVAGEWDRWAVVVGSSLAKMQATRVLSHDQAKAFLSLHAAEMWVKAYDPIAVAK
jgi:hypothetical protein